MLGYKDWKQQQSWRLEKCLGQGSFASVHAAVHTETGERAAVKVMHKDHEDNTDHTMRCEVNVMQEVSRKLPGNIHLVQLMDVFEDEAGVYLLMPLCHGWQLQGLLDRCGFFTEQYAAWVTQQVATALFDLHQAGIIHRDIKPENIMFSGTSPASPLKLIDFGLATTRAALEDAELEAVGSPDYVAPEVLRWQQYGPCCDIWSAGIMMYYMLCGNLPFASETQIRQAPLRFHGKVWSIITQDAKDLLRKLLAKDPARRPSAAELLAHKWVQAAEEPSLQQQLSFQQLPMGLLRSKSCGGGLHRGAAARSSSGSCSSSASGSGSSSSSARVSAGGGAAPEQQGCKGSVQLRRSHAGC